ncbi:DinB family protein [Adhaeribacter radiodurans]|uniref:DinB family protein n=1 Tax=Adhaeribacter radiodurans TaxID=2745197 RepID=A0A7L7L9B4_9BACT|nr:DinB family protein [Adhaeribacter radiodurans]QMU29105.1 DinB family protein [Adhaeribacter radiodurans]
MQQDQVIRDNLVKLLRSGQAFKPLEEVLSGINVEEAGKKVPKLPYTLWQVIEHLRIALFDILDFSRGPNYESPEWPAGYWLEEIAPANQEALDTSIQTIQDGLEQMIQLVQDPANNLYTPFAHGTGQNLLREALLVAEHNAYHLGEIIILRRLLGNWE